MLGFARLPPGLLYPEIYEMQVRAICGGDAVAERRRGAARRDHAPARRHRRGAAPAARARRRASPRRRAAARLPRRHDDRAAAGLRARRRDRRARGLLLLRHERPDADGARPLARRRRGQFLPHYLEHGILERDPFETLDQAGVGDLMGIAVERGRGAKDELKLGICGEHGGDPESVAFCHRLGLDYVSCSPVSRPARAAGRRPGRARRVARRGSSPPAAEGSAGPDRAGRRVVLQAFEQPCPRGRAADRALRGRCSTVQRERPVGERREDRGIARRGRTMKKKKLTKAEREEMDAQIDAALVNAPALARLRREGPREARSAAAAERRLDPPGLSVPPRLQTPEARGRARSPRRARRPGRAPSRSSARTSEPPT